MCIARATPLAWGVWTETCSRTFQIGFFFPKVSVIFDHPLEMMQPRLRVGQKPGQGHTASTWQSQAARLGHLNPNWFLSAAKVARTSWTCPSVSQSRTPGNDQGHQSPGGLHPEMGSEGPSLHTHERLLMVGTGAWRGSLANRAPV